MSMTRFCKSNIVSILPDASLQEAALFMKERSVGCLVVIERDGRTVGVLTDRDIVVKAAVDGLDFRAEKVYRHMSQDLALFPEDGEILDAVQTMKKYSVRRLLIANSSGRICGLLSVDDLLQLVAEEVCALSDLFYAQNGTSQRHYAHEYTQMI